MIFETTPDQIRRLDPQQLVTLLRQLIQAELAKHSIPLRSGTAPAQLTIPDGGDDGRVTWTGGPDKTDWLPDRFTIFQCKKGDPGPAGLKAETQSKSSKSSDGTPILSEAMTQVLRHRGAYVVATAAPVVGTNVDHRIEAIKAGISETENDVSALSAVEIYDCNKLSEWTNVHPSVALWLNSLLREVHLGGFQAYEDWAKAPGIAKGTFVDSQSPRFVLEGRDIQQRAKNDKGILEPKSFAEISHLVGEFFNPDGKSVRVIGPSGYGKTRFAHQLINQWSTSSSSVAEFDNSQTIYCIYDDVSDRLINIVREIVDSGSPLLLIVDDCPETIHGRLHNIFIRRDSNGRLVTIGATSKSLSISKSITVRLEPAADDLIESIARSVNEQLSQKSTSFVCELSEGFPRMAVLSAEALTYQDQELSTVDSLIERIIWGERQPDDTALKALQILSLFSVVGMEHEAKAELEKLAAFSEETYKCTYQSLKPFEERGVISRQGDYGIVQPIPLAMRLAKGWIDDNPSGSLETLFSALDNSMKLKMLSRLRWLSWSEEVRFFAATQLYEILVDDKALDTEIGSKILNRLVHLAPDEAMERLQALLDDHSIDELRKFETGRRYVVWALEMLAFRQQTFVPAARLLLRLGAAENEQYANNASSQFVGFYQLYLSGTESSQEKKLLVLDEGLASPDERIRKICVDALGRMLERNHFSRSGGAEQIGAAAPLRDWQPATYGEMFDYYRVALTRLETVALNDECLSEMALQRLSNYFRSMFSMQPLYDELKGLIGGLIQKYPRWYGPLKGLNSWLFFDAKKADDAYQNQLRSYYDELLPKEPAELLLFYSSGGILNIHDPDQPYDIEQATDHDFRNRQIKAIVQKSSKTAADYSSLLDEFFSRKSISAYEAIHAIAQHVDEPKALMRLMLDKISSEGDHTTIVQFIRGVILGANQQSKEQGLGCLHMALASKVLQAEAVNLISAVKPDDNLVRQVIAFIKADVVRPYQAHAIAWDDYLQDISAPLIEELLGVILSKDAEGAWAAIRFISRWLYSFEPEESWILEIVIKTVTNSALFKNTQWCSFDWYNWQLLAEKLLKSKATGSDFRLQLLAFVMSATDIADYNCQLSFERDVQKVLRLLVDQDPKLVWEKYHEKNESADANVKFRLESLFNADFRNSTGGGVLDEIPEEIYIPWVMEDKDKRMEAVISWMQVFEGAEDIPTWSPKFVEFIDTFVDNPKHLESLFSRITSGSWTGNYSDLLETRRNQLSSLYDLSNNPYVKQWLNQRIANMKHDITTQRRHDANLKASYMT